MLSESLATAIMTASITGAGLIIAFYALIARMSDRIFANRFEQLGLRRQEIKQITSNRDSFNDKNLKKTTSRLTDLRKEITSMKTFPKYLGLGVGVNFSLFLLASLFSFAWINGFGEAPINDSLILILFLAAIFLFLGVGIYGIYDVNSAIEGNFEKLKKEKEEAEYEITDARRGAGILDKIESIISSMGLSFERTVPVKVNGITLFPDLVVPTASNPKFVIEVWTRISYNLLSNLSRKYEKLKEDNIKTVLVSDFQDYDPYLRIAEAYWDYVIDLKKLDELKKIFKS